MNDITIYNYDPTAFLKIREKIYDPERGIKRRESLGQLYIISALREKGYGADFKDLQFLNFKEKKDILQFFENSPDVIGIGCVSRILPSLLLLIKELKKEYPEKTIILGGPGPTTIAEEILKISSGVDIIVKGEGEETIVELMDCLEKNKDLKNVRGIGYRDGNKIRTNPPRPRIENLDEIPFPARDKLDIKKYDWFGIITSRGCPYKCTFCHIPLIWNGGAILRSVDNVIEEIKLIYEKYDHKKICIQDDTFPVNKKRVLEFCDKLKREKIDVRWLCSGRIDLMDDQIMKKMSESGCDTVFYGVESGSDKILRKVKKGFSAKQAEDVLKKSKKYFRNVNTSFIWGFPFETMEDFKKTIKLAEKLLLKLNVGLRLSILHPLMGTEIYNKYKDSLMPLSSFERKSYNILRAAELIAALKLFNKDKDISKTIGEQPLSIKLEYYRYKNPNFSEKIKIAGNFIKKHNLNFY